MGNDSAYMGACLIAYLKQVHCGQSFTKNGDERNLKLNDFEMDVLGHGISKVVYTDIEYFYAIDANNFYVFKVSCWENPYTFALIETHPIKVPVLNYKKEGK